MFCPKGFNNLLVDQIVNFPLIVLNKSSFLQTVKHILKNLASRNIDIFKISF